MKRSCFKGCFCSKAGFTLIELLVVVLIIGILAAVALPQYQKAVARSQFAQLQSLVDALYKSQKVYYLANGKWATTLDVLDVTLPGQLDDSKRHIIQGNIKCGFNASYNNEMQCYYLFQGNIDKQKPVALIYVNKDVRQCRACSIKASQVCATATNQALKELNSEGWIAYNL